MSKIANSASQDGSKFLTDSSTCETSSFVTVHFSLLHARRICAGAVALSAVKSNSSYFRAFSSEFSPIEFLSCRTNTVTKFFSRRNSRSSVKSDYAAL